MTLPPELGMLNLKVLHVQGNILRGVRRPILEKGAGAILEYLKTRLPQDIGM